MKNFPRNHRDMRFCANGVMITNNSNDNYVFLYVFMFRIVSMLLMIINPQKEIFHNSCLYGLKVSGPEIRHLPVNNPVVTPENAIIFVRYFDVLMM